MKSPYSRTLLLFLMLIFSYIFFPKNVVAQADTTNTKPLGIKKALLPVIYYTPETRLALGAGVSLAFKIKSAKTISTVQIGAVYTLRKQFLGYLPFNLFIGRGDSWRIKGEIGIYDFIYEYYGIGDMPGERELYTAKFPRVRFAAYKKLKPKLYAGINWEFDDFSFSGLTFDGKNFTPETHGIDGGRISGFGPSIQWDNRDGQYWTKKGYFVESGLVFGDKSFGSSYKFGRFYLDYRHFFALPKSQVLGWQVYQATSWGATPFFHLPILGGSKLLRGYYKGYLRGQTLFMTQVEYRRHLFWKFDMAVFAGIGTVGESWIDVAYNLFWPSYGAGIRFPLVKKAGLNLRLDYAFGRKNSGFYLTFGEAF